MRYECFCSYVVVQSDQSNQWRYTLVPTCIKNFEHIRFDMDGTKLYPKRILCILEWMTKQFTSMPTCSENLPWQYPYVNAEKYKIALQNKDIYIYISIHLYFTITQKYMYTKSPRKWYLCTTTCIQVYYGSLHLHSRVQNRASQANVLQTNVKHCNPMFTWKKWFPQQLKNIHFEK